jgi:hypothetical protein
MKFSERLSIQPIKTQLQTDSIDTDLKNSLWTVVHETFLALDDSRYSDLKPKFSAVCFRLWIDFFKYPIDTLLLERDETVRKGTFSEFLRAWFFKAKWFEIYDILDFLADFEIKGFVAHCNIFLEREVSAFRFVDNKLTRITSEEEIKEIEDALKSDDKYINVKKHLSIALGHLSDRKNPDYRNSIKESISAVEALCIIITGDQKASLGTALKVIEKEHKLHGSLKNAFTSLYGYTSDKSGIRHALTEDSTILGFDDAKFFLVSCSAFVNYLISKLI